MPTGIDAITTAFVNDYTSNVELLLQQMGSVLRDTVRVESFVGENADFIEQVGKVVAKKRVTRHGDTPLVPTPMDRRWVFPTDYELADLVDSQDKLRMIIDPTSPYAQAQAAALGRAIDDEIVEGILGNNSTGQQPNSTTVTLPAANIILNGGTGMTIDKLREIRRKMEQAEVNFDMDTPWAILDPLAKENLLQTTEVTSDDYNTVKALVQGEINTFMGFNFKGSNRLPGGIDYTGSVDPGANITRNLFYVQSGVGLGMWNDINTRVDERPDKSYSTQIYAKGTFGGTRLQENKVYAADALNT